MQFDLLVRGATIIDGTGKPPYKENLYVRDGKIVEPGDISADNVDAKEIIDADGLCLAPGFIDVHTHDDINVIQNPQMLAKISQGVTTVIVGNCGISASPIAMAGDPPDPINLLGNKQDFKYPEFADYSRAVEAASPHTNVAALVGHTTLRTSAMDDLNRAAEPGEIEQMKQHLNQALKDGALGFSSGLAYGSANKAPMEELVSMMDALAEHNAVYVTHLRTEFDAIVEALQEAFATANHSKVPLVVSHLKCAGVNNWGRADEIIKVMESAAQKQELACDCYPYSASSSTLDLAQVNEEVDIFITWSDSVPEAGGRLLADLAAEWNLSLEDTAKKIQPAGAVYHCMDEEDVQKFLSYQRTMIGSDGLPGDPHPHPRLWGTFPRFIGHYSRDMGLVELHEAIYKMTGLSAKQFALQNRGTIKAGNWADLVLFNPDEIADKATFSNPQQPADGIVRVWVNGALSYANGATQGSGAGQFLYRN